MLKNFYLSRVEYSFFFVYLFVLDKPFFRAAIKTLQAFKLKNELYWLISIHIFFSFISYYKKRFITSIYKCILIYLYIFICINYWSFSIWQIVRGLIFRLVNSPINIDVLKMSSSFFFTWYYIHKVQCVSSFINKETFNIIHGKLYYLTSVV